MELAEDEQSDDSKSEKEDEDPNLHCYIQKMNDFRDELFKKAKSKIVDAQMKQKRDWQETWQEKGTNQKQLTVHYVKFAYFLACHPYIFLHLHFLYNLDRCLLAYMLLTTRTMWQIF